MICRQMPAKPLEDSSRSEPSGCPGPLRSGLTTGEMAQCPLGPKLVDSFSAHLPVFVLLRDAELAAVHVLSFFSY
jgi:hypothetical protein